MTSANRRILIADDLPAIHDDYKKILNPKGLALDTMAGMEEFAPHLATQNSPQRPPFQIETVVQGEDAIQSVTRARAEGRPFAMVFLDVRMPPGIDGVETAERLRAIDPSLQVVLCTAYADYSFADISRRFRDSDGLLILKKPFDPVEVQQLAHALCHKWMLSEENRALMANLEARVQQRTNELEQAKGELEVALVKAESASRTKSDFLRCVSHELNTPLNGILGAASVIELSADAELAEMGRIVLESSERLNRLFSRILLYLQIDRQPSAEQHLIQLSDVVEQAVIAHREQAILKGISFKVENRCPPALYFNGEIFKLSEALSNVVENAVKFTHQGQVSIRLNLQENRFFIAEVQDTGPGIQNPQLTQLYELFSPGDLELNRKHDGIGIGLTLAKRIAEHLGGGIQYRNRQTGGSIFTLTLPCKVP
ncbi:MAG: hybrid sensor histidine kinase/response regulator [Verrucomicrobia bacterium]|nr:hybrid sensor histidine kinase/response regulator [Verrucomicrobiota bacterium]